MEERFFKPATGKKPEEETLNDAEQDPADAAEVAQIFENEDSALDSVEMPASHDNPEKSKKAENLKKKFEKTMRWLTAAAMLTGGVAMTNINSAEASNFGQTMERSIGREAGRGAGKAVGGIFDAIGDRVIRGIGGGETPREKSERIRMETRERIRQEREERSMQRREEAQYLREKIRADRDLSRQIQREKSDEKRLELEAKKKMLRDGRSVEINGKIYNAPQ